MPTVVGVGPNPSPRHGDLWRCEDEGVSDVGVLVEGRGEWGARWLEQWLEG